MGSDATALIVYPAEALFVKTATPAGAVIIVDPLWIGASAGQRAKRRSYLRSTSDAQMPVIIHNRTIYTGARMAKFYFHLDECDNLLIDPEGRELPSAEAAREHAIREARHVISFDAMEGQLRLACAIVVEDQRRLEVLRLPFREAVVLTE